uniref:Uncharacterized protein n=1 Tax=Oryzias melastigma TaxID=30732 RepID=A0A3B3BI91_ORYME
GWKATLTLSSSSITVLTASLPREGWKAGVWMGAGKQQSARWNRSKTANRLSLNAVKQGLSVQKDPNNNQGFQTVGVHKSIPKLESKSRGRRKERKCADWTLK